MQSEIISKVQSMGFDVYMRRQSDSYLVFSDGERLGYLEYDRMAGFTLSTVHVPNQESGTGFQVARHVGDFDRALLLECFEHFPSWAQRRGMARPTSWASVEAWRNASSFNRDYALVPATATASPE